MLEHKKPSSTLILTFVCLFSEERSKKWQERHTESVKRQQTLSKNKLAFELLQVSHLVKGYIFVSSVSCLNAQFSRPIVNSQQITKEILCLPPLFLHWAKSLLKVESFFSKVHKSARLHCSLIGIVVCLDTTLLSRSAQPSPCSKINYAETIYFFYTVENVTSLQPRRSVGNLLRQPLGLRNQEIKK